MFVKISDYVDHWQWGHLAQFYMEVNSVMRIRTLIVVRNVVLTLSVPRTYL